MNELDKTDMNMQQKITPHLWFDNNVEEAAKFYTSIFKNSRIMHITYYGESAAEVARRPKGTIMTVTFELEGQRFMALSCVLCYVFHASFVIAVKPIRHFSCSGFCEVITAYVVGLELDLRLCIIRLISGHKMMFLLKGKRYGS